MIDRTPQVEKAVFVGVIKQGDDPKTINEYMLSLIHI